MIFSRRKALAILWLWGAVLAAGASAGERSAPPTGPASEPGYTLIAWPPESAKSAKPPAKPEAPAARPGPRRNAGFAKLESIPATSAIGRPAQPAPVVTTILLPERKATPAPTPAPAEPEFVPEIVPEIIVPTADSLTMAPPVERPALLPVAEVIIPYPSPPAEPFRELPAVPVPVPAPVAVQPVVKETGSAFPAAGRWLKTPLHFYADRSPLEQLLREFAAKQGVGAKVSPRLSGVVSGDIDFKDPAEFLRVISRTHLLDWYFDGASVHFYPNDEMHTRLLPLENVNAGALRNSLARLGLLDGRFEWTATEDGRLLKIQGPEVYLDKIADILEQEKAVARERKDVAQAGRREKKLQVIRLNYAWADKRDIVTSDSSITVPGVAELLRQILSSQYSSGGSDVAPTPLGMSSFHRGRGEGIVGRRRAAEAAAAGAAADAASGVPPAEFDLRDDVPFVKADPRLNAVLVWDVEENHARNERIVRELDQPLAMVEIRAAILDIEADRTRDLGISWEAKEGSGKWTNSGGVNSGLDDDYTSVKGDGFNFTTIYSHGLDSLMLRVKAMEKEGAADVLSRPSVLTQDNIQATLEQTETFYVKLEGYQDVDLADIRTGMTLRVTPHIIDEGAGGIQLSVHLTTGSDSGSGSGSDYTPRVKQSAITTQAVVHEGEALVIGGYYNETRNRSETGVPFFRKLPVVGALFRERYKNHVKTEKLFVLSPRIVYPGNSMMSHGSRAEYIIEHSPERDALEEPIEDDACGTVSKERRKRRTLSMDMD